MATLKEQIEAAKLAKQQKVNPLKQKIDAAKEAEKSGGEKFMEGAYKSMFPKWLRENTPIGAVANTVSGAPQAIVDTANILPTIAEWRSPFIKSGSMGRIPDVPLPAPESSTFGRTAAEWATPVPGAKFDKIADTLIGLSAATGKEMSDEIGEVTGGLGATGIAFLNALRGKATTPGDKASNLLLDNAGTEVGADQAAKNIENALAQGEIGTAAELAKSEGMFAVENIIGKPGTQASRDIQKITGERSQQIIDEAGNIITGEGDILSKAGTVQSDMLTKGQAQINALRQSQTDELGEYQPKALEAYEELRKAQKEAQLASEVVETPLDPSQASTQLYETVKKQAGDYDKEVVKPLYKIFEDGEKVTGQQFKDAVTKWGDENLTPTQGRIVNQKFKEVIGLVNKLDKKIEPLEAQQIVSEMKKIINTALKPGGVGGSTANKSLGEMADSLEEALLGTSSGKAYQEATDAYSAGKKRFSPARIAKAANSQEPETFFRSLMDTGAGGAAVARQILNSGDEKIIEAFKEGFRATAKDEGNSAAFLKKHEELLNSFPQLKADFEIDLMGKDEVVSAQENLIAVNKGDAAQQSLLKKAKEKVNLEAQEKTTGLKKSVDKKAVSEFKKDPETFLDKALLEDNSIKKTGELKKLLDQFETTKGGKEALRAGVRDRFLRKINKSQTGESTVSLQSVGDFHKMKDNLIASGLMTKDEVAEIEKLMDRAKLSGMRKTSGKLMLNSVEDSIADAKASIASIAALEALPNSTNQLMLANTVKRFFKKKFDDSTSHDKATLLALENMITDPQKLLDAIVDEGIRSQEHLEQYLNKTIKATTQTVADDKEEE